MTESGRFERRLAALIDRYADGAPMDADPMAIVRFAAAAAGRIEPRHDQIDRGRLLIGLAAVLVTAAAVGGLLFVGAPQPTPAEATQPAPPATPKAPPVIGYVGLPPVGVEPSRPETGELVFEYSARAKPGLSRAGVPCCPKEDFMLYADGRMIWETEAAQGAVATGFLEQRLTPSGVEYARSALELTGLFGDGALDQARGGFFWGFATLALDGRHVSIEWGGAGMEGAPVPATLRQLHQWVIDPGAWLPTGVWADTAVRPFISARYAVCIGDQPRTPDDFDRLPALAATILLERSSPLTDTVTGVESPGCASLDTNDAREFVSALVDAGFEEVEDDMGGVAYWRRPGDGSAVRLTLDPMLPDGRPRCRCG